MTAPDEDRRPRDVAAERAVLGAMLLSTDAIATAARILGPDDFYRHPHAALYATLVELFQSGHPTDPVSVAAVLTERGSLHTIGGAPALHGLIAETPTAANVGYWAEVVFERAKRARVLDLGVRLQQLAITPGADTAEVEARALEAVETTFDARQRSDEQDGGWLGDLIDDHVDSWDEERPSGVPAPFVDLNALFAGRGLLPGQLAILAARPGAGKSVMASDWARHAARNHHGTLFVSLEMDRAEIMNRLIAAEAKVWLADINARNLDAGQRAAILRATRQLAELPLRIEDRFAVTMARLRAVARDVARSEAGLGLLVVDYIQLVTPADPRLARREQVDAISRGLKSLARELAVPVLAVAQLNREVEGRPDRTPRLSDLRESGSLEQDADVVMMLNRPDTHDHADPRAGEADIHVVKNRNGPTATITVAHQLRFSRFDDIARGYDESGAA